MTSDRPPRPAARMVEGLAARGELDPAWRGAFTSVPRHAFIPDTVWRRQDGELAPLHRGEDEAAWLDHAYGPGAVIIQVDDGTPGEPGQTGRYPTSSVSQPNVIALMLAALGAEPGMSVCEIGTGSGYNAALLAARLGAEHVTSIEVDPTLAEHARRALAAAGHDVTVITGDGAEGHPPRAPFDRILSTAAVQHVPYPWVAQTRPGGRIVTPWGTAYHNGALVALTVAEDGIAEGRIVGNVAFMWLRDQRVRASIDDQLRHHPTARRGRTTLAPYDLAGHYDASLAIGIRVPGCSNIFIPPGTHTDDGECDLWFVDPDTDSWANLHYTPHAREYEVLQAGPRDLFDEIDTAYRWWTGQGRPGAARWRITVTPDGQRVSLASAPHTHPGPAQVMTITPAPDGPLSSPRDTPQATSRLPTGIAETAG